MSDPHINLNRLGCVKKKKTFDLISVIFFTDPNLFKLICGFDIDMILNHFCRVLRTQYFKLY